MNRPGKVFRIAVALLGLFVVFMLVINYWGDYRATRGGGESAEATASVEASDTVEPQDGEEEPPEEESASKGSIVVLTDGLKFRKDPSKDAEMLGSFDQGDRLEYLGTEDSWHKVRADDGTEGYVSASASYTKLEQ